MSNLSILRGVIAFIDNVDGKGAEVFAAAILADPRAADQLPDFVTPELLSEVLEEDGPRLRAIAENQPTEITGALLGTLVNPSKGKK
jgi:hypothetical protein